MKITDAILQNFCIFAPIIKNTLIMQNSKTKKKKADYDVNESVQMVNEPIASYAVIGKAWKKPTKKQEDPFSLEEYYDELEETMAETTPVDDETALANAVSMDTMLEWILEDIHEYYQNLKNETTDNNSTRSKELLQ